MEKTIGKHKVKFEKTQGTYKVSIFKSGVFWKQFKSKNADKALDYYNNINKYIKVVYAEFDSESSNYKWDD
tara:strand:- start:5775 stop:5987 length:213 start_codon:yes stop_codon:yes gene_type:complete